MRSQPARLHLILTIGSLVAIAMSASLSAQNPAPVGTWKLNVAKSKFPPGPPPKSGMIKFEAAGAQATTTLDTVLADGSTQHIAYTAPYDGKDTPIGKNALGFETVARRRVNATTTEATFKTGGKVMGVSTVILSPDGKTLTIATKATDPQGKAVTNVQVYDKQ